MAKIRCEWTPACPFSVKSDHPAAQAQLRAHIEDHVALDEARAEASMRADRLATREALSTLPAMLLPAAIGPGRNIMQVCEYGSCTHLTRGRTCAAHRG